MIVIEGIDGVGKSSLVDNLIKGDYKLDTDKVYKLVITDVVKHGMYVPSDIIIDYDKEQFNKIRLELKEVLNKLSSYSKNDTILKSDLVYYYNCIMIGYLEIAKMITPVLNQLENNGYTIIADRWIMSTIAYNGSIKNTFISKLIEDTPKSRTPFVLADNKYRINRKGGNERYYAISHMVNNYMKGIKSPDVTIYLTCDPREVHNRIVTLRGETDHFEDKDKLTRTHKVYNMIINDINNKCIVNTGKLKTFNTEYGSLFNIEDTELRNEAIKLRINMLALRVKDYIKNIK